MFQKIIKYIKYGAHYGAVEHQNSDEKEKLALLLLKKQQNVFSIVLQQRFSSITGLAKVVMKEQHLYLVINNNHVISKIIPKNLHENKAIQTAFPTIKITDFYYEIIQLNEKTHIAICRKDYIQKLIAKYHQQNINIVGFTLGNSGVTHLLPFIETSHISTSNASLLIKNKKVSTIDIVEKINQKSYTINGLEITNNYMLALASIIAFYTNNFTPSNNFKGYNLSIFNQYIQKRLVKLSLKTGLGLLFIALIINFFIFDFYNKQIDTLIQKSQINQSYKEQLLLLNEELDNKKKLIDDIVNSSSSKTSLYFDQIAASTPNTILLNSIVFQPILKKIETKKKIVYNQHTIFIKGTTLKSVNFSKWIKRLETLTWVNAVEIIDYGSGKNLKTTFELRILLK